MNTDRLESLKIPIRVDELLESLIHSELAKGNIRLQIDSFNLAIPAGAPGTNNNLITIPPGSVSFIYKMHEIVSDTYTPNLRMTFLIDSGRNTPLDTTIRLDRVKDFSITHFLKARETLGWAFFNWTGGIINVSVTIQLLHMNIGFYETWFRPIMNHSYNILNDLSEELRKK